MAHSAARLQTLQDHNILQIEKVQQFFYSFADGSHITYKVDYKSLY